MFFRLVSFLLSYEAFDIAYLCCMLNACPPRSLSWRSSSWSLCSPVVRHWNEKSKGLTFDSSWGLLIFYFCPTLETRRMNIFSTTVQMKLTYFLFYLFSVVRLRTTAARRTVWLVTQSITSNSARM